jgi:polyisoprenoid-binding protein YceI
MLKSTPARILLAVVAVVVIALAAIVVFDIDLLALIPETETSQPAPAAVAPVAATEAAATPAGPAAAAPAADASADTAAAAAPSAGDGALTFSIDQSASEARFFVNEVLVGIPTEVKGVTSLISGTVTVDPANPAASQTGPISVDASDLKTDRNLRNRAIRRFILETGNYQYITFTPTAVSGLPDQAAPGDTFAFQVTGDLQIKDVTQPVTFDVEVTADSAAQISGLAKATVKRSDFNLTIPSAPGVADVTDEVRLELAFTAVAEG